MKEVVCTARNIMVLPDDEDMVRPMVETIVVVSEPTFGFDRGGQLAKERTPETIRFLACPEALRKMSAHFAEWADEADEFARLLMSNKKEGEKVS